MSDSHQKLFEGYEKGPDQKWTIPNDNQSGVYRFILAAARRARQLQNGQRPLINTTLRKPTKIAMEEIRTGAVAVEIIPEDQPWPPAAVDLGESQNRQDELEVNADLDRDDSDAHPPASYEELREQAIGWQVGSLGDV